MGQFKTIEQTLSSQEVAEMVGKEHSKLMRDIRRYAEQLSEAKIGLGDFFQENSYKDVNNQSRPCYRITKKGCEFIAHKLTGIKGTIFTARYINRFHEMQDIISGQKAELPWFIRNFRGRYVVLERDFSEITGVDVRKHKLFYRMEYFRGGVDYNGWGWKCNNEEFKQEYGFDYGEEPCMMYFRPCGVKKALDILEKDGNVVIKLDAKRLLLDGLKSIEAPRAIELEEKKLIQPKRNIRKQPIQVIINLDNNLIKC